LDFWRRLIPERDRGEQLDECDKFSTNFTEPLAKHVARPGQPVAKNIGQTLAAVCATTVLLR
jgi:hypothetical protein